MAEYTFSTTMPGPIEDARQRVIEALSTEGFGVLTEIDVAATLKKKIGETIDPYLILGACNPPLAHRAISTEPAIGALLPCNVVLRAAGDHVIVDFMNPESVLTLVEAEGISTVATEVRNRLERVRGLLAG